MEVIKQHREHKDKPIDEWGRTESPETNKTSVEF